jgi:hypothetical protein
LKVLEPLLQAAALPGHDAVQVLGRTAWAILFDAYHDAGFLAHEPLHVALACVQAAASVLEMPLPVALGGTWWAVFAAELDHATLSALALSLVGVYTDPGLVH